MVVRSADPLVITLIMAGGKRLRLRAPTLEVSAQWVQTIEKVSDDRMHVAWLLCLFAILVD